VRSAGDGLIGLRIGLGFGLLASEQNPDSLGGQPQPRVHQSEHQGRQQRVSTHRIGAVQRSFGQEHLKVICAGLVLVFV
jgi:hypothetical protein